MKRLSRSVTIVFALLYFIIAVAFCSGCGQSAYDEKLESRVKDLHANPPAKQERNNDYSLAADYPLDEEDEDLDDQPEDDQPEDNEPEDDQTVDDADSDDADPFE
jgi:hypothetical protein